MKLIKHLPLIAFALGMPVAHAQAPNAGVASPFGAVPSAAAPASAAVPSLSLAQVKAGLTAAAAKKIRPQLLDAVARGEQREVIVMFQDQSGAAGIKQQAQRLTMEKNAFSATRQSARTALGAANVVFLREYAHLPFALVRVQNNAALINLLNHPLVVNVAENVSVTPQTNESLPLIHQPQVVANGRLGTGATVAVLDTGANIATPSLGYCNAANSPASCRVVATHDVTGTGFTTGGTSALHGTTVAEIVAQVAPGAKLALVEMYVDSTGSIANILQGMSWAIENQAKYNIVTLNLNAAYEDSGNGLCDATNGDYQTMSAALAKLREARIFPVIAAGNNFAINGRRNFPACAAGGGAAAVVAAVYDRDMNYDKGGHNCKDYYALANQLTCFSARDSWVNIAAPGAIIYTGINEGGMPSGTSYAAPHVAGTVAMLRAPNAAPHDTPEQTLGRLRNTGFEVVPTSQPADIRIPRLDMMASLNSVFHVTVTQQFYISLLGRPADPGGLQNFSHGLRDTGAPSTLRDLNRLYDDSTQIRALVDSVGASAEVAALYPGDNAAFVTAMYQNIVNRAPDPTILAYWKGHLDSGGMTRGRIALAIASFLEEYKDGATLYKKAAVANNFTLALDLPAEQAAYQRSSAEARAMLKTVNAATYVEDMDRVIVSTIAKMLSR